MTGRATSCSRNTVARLAQLGALERIERDHTLNPVAHRVSILGHEIVGVVHVEQRLVEDRPQRLAKWFAGAQAPA